MCLAASNSCLKKFGNDLTIDTTKSHMLDLAPCRKYTEDVIAQHINSEQDSESVFGSEDENDISSPINIAQTKKDGMTRLYSARL